MKTAANNNESVSGTTSQSAPETEKTASMSEAEFLRQEAARAQAAIGEAIGDLRRNLKATADPKILTRDHPWIAISTAAVAGFAAALTLTPTKEQQALRALAELERARHAPPQSSDPASDPKSDNRTAKEEAGAGFLGLIIAELLKTIRPLLTTLLTAGITQATGGKANSQTDANGVKSNGHAQAQDPGIASPS
jgi:ElaB/YqjD/DUF883 family membrane-anchored ribosome-binding protein